jgi:CBS domain-containing protein
MLTTNIPLLAMTAADLMKRPVVCIPQEMTLRAAAHVLKREQISGAAVVDAAGACVGVLSATDFLKWAEQDGHGAAIHCQCHPDYHSEWEVIDVEVLPREEVRYHMSADVVTVAATTPIHELARRMIDAHIHRLFVVDSARRPIGVVTTTDVVAAVAYAETTSGH